MLHIGTASPPHAFPTLLHTLKEEARQRQQWRASHTPDNQPHTMKTIHITLLLAASAALSSAQGLDSIISQVTSVGAGVFDSAYGLRGPSRARSSLLNASPFLMQR